jgi:hypothetical protein
MKTISIGLIILALLTSKTTLADSKDYADEPGWYMGLSFNSLRTLQVSGDHRSKGKGTNKDRSGIGLVGGYYFNPNFAIELESIKFDTKDILSCDNPDESRNCVAWSSGYKASSVGLLGQMWLLQDFDGFAKLAYSKVDYQNTWKSISKSGASAEIGIVYTKYEQFSIIGSIERVNIPVGNGRIDDTEQVSVKLVYRF